MPNDNNNINDILHCPNLKIWYWNRLETQWGSFKLMVMCPIPLYKILTLECTGDINNNVINMISEKCEVLEKLSLINI